MSDDKCNENSCQMVEFKGYITRVFEELDKKVDKIFDILEKRRDREEVAANKFTDLLATLRTSWLAIIQGIALVAIAAKMWSK